MTGARCWRSRSRRSCIATVTSAGPTTTFPSEKFPSLIEELVEVLSPGGQIGHGELVNFLLGTQRLSSIQERAAKLEAEFAIYRRTNE